MPALYNLARTGLLPPRLTLIGVDHNKKTSDEWQAAIKDFLLGILEKNGEALDEKLWGQIALAA